jgi:cell division protease FtsH
MPDIKDREAILKVHIRKKPLASGIDLRKIAQQTPGFSGADIQNLVNEAAILAARRNKKKIGMKEFTEAVEKVLLGPERKGRLLSLREKKITAYHESGHALVAKMLPHCDPVHKVSIVARGLAAGYTWSLPVEDIHIYSRSKFEDDLASMLAGRTAEKLMFGEVTTGAENDLREATRLARKMVTEYGMSEKLGAMTFGHKEELIFLGREIGEQRNYSEEVAAKIDEEVRNIIEKALRRASEILTKHKKKLKQIAEKLIKEETIEGEVFNKLFKGIKVPKKMAA